MEENNNNAIVKGLAIILIAILGLNVYRTETTKKEMAQLADTVEQISARLDSLSIVKVPSANSIKTSAASCSSSAKGRISVSAKVKVEDRYVSGTTYLPKITTGPTGVVVVGITISHSGSVTSARIKSESTITDEDVLDACKDAALRTSFNVNIDVSNKHPATIIYTFAAK